jgi:hypothetical protein
MQLPQETLAAYSMGQNTNAIIARFESIGKKCSRGLAERKLIQKWINQPIPGDWLNEN